jgi:hypothetical protein
MINNKMRFLSYLLGGALLITLSSEETKSYGNVSSGTLVDDENHICNGDFELPIVPLTAVPPPIITNIDVPCWVGSKNKIQIGPGNSLWMGCRLR